MTSTCFNKAYFFLLVDDVDLGDEGQGLQPDRETPAELQVRVVDCVGVHEDCYHQDGRVDVEVVLEAVGVLVVSQAVRLLETDQIDDVNCQTDIKKLHHCQVERCTIVEEISVSGNVYKQINFLGSVRNFCN